MRIAEVPQRRSDEGKVPRTTREVAQFVAQPAVAEAISQMAELGRVLGPAVRRVAGHFSSLQEFMTDVAPLIANLVDALDRLPSRTRTALVSMANRGWYLDETFDFGQLVAIAMAFEGGDPAFVEEELCEHFEAQIDRILADTKSHFPSRYPIIAEALVAHQEKRYWTSIPTLLIQAEGICRDIIGVSPYAKSRGRNEMRIAKVLEGHASDSLLRAFLEPLIIPTPLSMNVTGGTASCLNRHAILHGLSVTYGSRINGCRAISLLVYLLYILRDVQKPGREA